ncbi:MAG TPA: hypothetical protein VGU01_02085 [Sphingomicrobium sp.]|nr:hypothetical protein [Sphingomicrobium sp.]
MTRARFRALLLLLSLMAAAALALAGDRGRQKALSARPPERRPTLLLLTSLPILFGEGFSLNGGGSPVLKRLQARYRVEPISITDPEELAKGRLLLMAQPQAQIAENLVALDAWLRGGGRLLLLADPLLEWDSDRPLGDLTRPSLMFMDTGLLAHWGLRLESPDQPGAAERQLGGYRVLTRSPGALFGACTISADRLVAHCRLGRGVATIVADADVLNVAKLGSFGQRNLDGLIAELASLEQS